MTKQSSTRGGTSRRRSTSQRSSTRKKTSRSTTRKKTTQKRPSQGLQLSTGQKALISGIGLILFTAILALSLLSPNQGSITENLSRALWKGFGWGGIVACVAGSSGILSGPVGMEQAPRLPIFRVGGLLLLFAAFEGLASLAAVAGNNGLSTVWEVAEEMRGGGYAGGAIAVVLINAVGQVGTALLLVLLGLLGAFLLFGISRADMGRLVAFVRAKLARRSAVAVGERAIPVNPRELPIQRRPSLRPVADEEAAPLPPIRTRSEPAAAAPAKAAGRSKPEEATLAAPPPVFITTDSGDFEQSGSCRSWTRCWSRGEQELSNATIREQVGVIEHTLESLRAGAGGDQSGADRHTVWRGAQFIERRNGKHESRSARSPVWRTTWRWRWRRTLCAWKRRCRAKLRRPGGAQPAEALVSVRRNAGAKLHAPAVCCGSGWARNVSRRAISADLAKCRICSSPGRPAR